MLALAGGAAAQPSTTPPDDGPVVVGTPREKWTGFRLMRLEAGLEYRFEYQRDAIEESGQPKRVNTETRHRELFDLSGESSIGHRNLIDLTYTFQLGLENVSTKRETESFEGSEQDFVNLYDVNALIFGTSRLPTSVYARRQQSLLDRPFAGSIDETVTEEGVNTRYQTETTSNSLQLFHREDRLSGDFGNIDSTTKQDSLTLQSNIALSPASRLDASYTFDHISERQPGYSDNYDRHNLSLTHVGAFGGDDKPHDLRSSLSVFTQDGRLSQNRTRWDEVLTLRHSRSLETRYSALLNHVEIRGQDQDVVRGEASIKHRLFESLTSVATIGAQRLDAAGSFTSDERFVSGQVDYTKRVPWGRLDAGLGASFNNQSNGARGEPLRIVNEAYTFTDGFPIILPRRNILPGSIVVTAAAGFPVYLEGSDYTVSAFPDRVEIRPVVGGGIVNGQSLRISYDVGPEPGSDIDTTTTSYSVRYTLTEGKLRGLAFYSTYRTVGFDLRSGNPDVVRLDDSNDLLLGVQYQRGGLDARYEYNRHDSDFDPYTIHRAQAIYSVSLGVGSSLNAEYTREQIDFRNQNNRVTFDRGALRSVWRVNPSFDLNFGLDYRNEDSTLNGNTRAFDQIVGFAWRRGRTSVTTSVRNSFLDAPRTSQTSQLVQFTIKRTF